MNLGESQHSERGVKQEEGDDAVPGSRLRAQEMREQPTFVIMGYMSPPARHEREWLAQWRRAGVALEQVRADELADLPDGDALAAADTLLALAATVTLPAHRVAWSGLVDLQRQLHATR